jgi:hypothetical protein
MIYYSLQNKKTKKLIKVYAMPFNDGEYDVTCYFFSTIGDSPWLASKEDAEKALEMPNFSSKNEAEYDNPYNWLEASEWEVVEVTLAIDSLHKNRMTSIEYCKNNGSICPYCKSKDTTGNGSMINSDNVTRQRVQCNECKKCWTDIHSLVGYEECDESKLS